MRADGGYLCWHCLGAFEPVDVEDLTVCPDCQQAGHVGVVGLVDCPGCRDKVQRLYAVMREWR